VQDIHRGMVGFLKPGCPDANDVNCLNDDPTKLENINAKFNLQLTEKNKFNFLFAYDDKSRATRGASDLRPLETTWKQSGPTYIYKFEDTHIVNPNLLFTGRFAYVDGGFRLDYQEPALRSV
jgi:gentisate 1,2-dioxygenase